MSYKKTFVRDDGRPVVGPADDATRRRLLAEKLSEKGDPQLYRAPPKPANRIDMDSVQRSTTNTGKPGDGDFVQNKANTDLAMGVEALGDPGGAMRNQLRRSGAE
jgi:hypothetical protein